MEKALIAVELGRACSALASTHRALVDLMHAAVIDGEDSSRWIYGVAEAVGQPVLAQRLLSLSVPHLPSLLGDRRRPH